MLPGTPELDACMQARYLLRHIETSFTRTQTQTGSFCWIWRWVGSVDTAPTLARRAHAHTHIHWRLLDYMYAFWPQARKPATEERLSVRRGYHRLASVSGEFPLKLNASLRIRAIDSVILFCFFFLFISFEVRSWKREANQKKKKKREKYHFSVYWRYLLFLSSRIRNRRSWFERVFVWVWPDGVCKFYI